MLDKSIPFHTIIMKSSNNLEVKPRALPEGFSVRFYEPGDELYWARIQYEVGEFSSIEDALNCFSHYKNHEEELRKRQIYIVDNETNTPVATATAWYSTLAGKEIGVVHALSCLPSYQALGLGRIAAEYMMECFHKVMPESQIWLDTQTWSYKAIGIYLGLGFVPEKSATFNETPNEYEQARNAMKDKMRADIYEKFCNLTKM